MREKMDLSKGNERGENVTVSSSTDRGGVSSMMRDIGEGGLHVHMQWSVMTRQTLDGVCLDGMC